MKNTSIINEKEKRVLTGLYKLKKGFVSQIAKETLINRTTLYPLLDKLLAKGLVSKHTIEGKVAYQPISLNDFKNWVKRTEQDTKKQAQELVNWAESQKISTKNSLLSDIKYYEGFDGVKNLYADTWRNNKDKIIYAITDYKKAYEVMRDFFRKEYFQTRVDHGVRVKNLIPESEEGRQDLKEAKEMLRQMKFIPLLKDFGIEINIYDAKVVIIAFDSRNPSGILIKNEIISRAFKNIFEHLWKNTRQIKSK
ncbi:hypothetical protein KKF61_05550 [Patescibacteria group bacterium]|nr:hypothetical protein [Patescibacteria group bacterium]MBU0963532.1 hypothetical protein [Patescibacteria group bacterium]